MLPETALDTLTGEDLRLLLNGVGDINVSTLSTYTSFNDESNESPEKLQRFKRWLWQIVERMTNLERQDLVSFHFLLTIIGSITFFICRSISGRAHLRCPPLRKVSSRCHQ